MNKLSLPVHPFDWLLSLLSVIVQQFVGFAHENFLFNFILHPSVGYLSPSNTNCSSLERSQAGRAKENSYFTITKTQQGKKKKLKRIFFNTISLRVHSASEIFSFESVDLRAPPWIEPIDFAFKKKNKYFFFSSFQLISSRQAKTKKNYLVPQFRFKLKVDNQENFSFICFVSEKIIESQNVDRISSRFSDAVLLSFVQSTNFAGR